MGKSLGKKHLVLSFLGGAVFFSGVSFAATNMNVTPNTEALHFYHNGEAKATQAQFNNNGTNVPQSFIYNGTTYVPIRHVGDLISQNVYWEGQQRTISIGQPVVEIKNSSGNAIGTITLTQADDGVLAKIDVSNLPPGKHGFHVHQSPITGNDFETAGSHLNPTDSQHGHLNPDGAHLGDFRNLEVAADGTAKTEMKLEGASLDKSSTASILGASLIIHADADDEKSDPTGNSGGRIAGGNVPQ